MNVAVVGTGYVGLVTGACLAETGNNVWCVDIDSKKVEALKSGKTPIYEPGLESMVVHNYKMGRLDFTTSIEDALQDCNICFIAVGTPMGQDGSADLEYVFNAAHDIGKFMTRHMYIVDKSTVPVGTAKMVRTIIQEALDQRESDLTFDMISNPEFLKEGDAINDCLKPDRIIIGIDCEGEVDVMRKLYAPYITDDKNFIIMDIKSAEMTKYAANAMLATKISFINEISNICERVGADINKVRLGIGSDRRIGFHFISPGCGYGGNCFPKDIQALIHTAKKYNYKPSLLESVEKVNVFQKHIIAYKVKKKFGTDLTGLLFAVWGLTFKPNTDDMRDSAAINIINDLVEAGGRVVAYDPKASESAKKYYFSKVEAITYAVDKYDAIKEADALILITQWDEFKTPDFDVIKRNLKTPIIFDGRNEYNWELMDNYGFEYYQIGVQGDI